MSKDIDWDKPNTVILPTKPKPKPINKKPGMFKVIFMNDDFTPIAFVIEILISVFNKASDEARSIALEVHQTGKAIAGTYSFEVAETKIMITMDNAKREGHPLMLSIERD